MECVTYIYGTRRNARFAVRVKRSLVYIKKNGVVMVNPVLCISDRTTPMAFEAEIYGTKEGVGYAAVCLPEGQYN